jgi:hypothetical protein
MRRWLLLLLVATGAAIALYHLLKSPPAFDLEGFDRRIDRLRAGSVIARKVADTDAIPDWLDADAEHIAAIRRILEAHDGDCEATVEALEQQLERHRQRLEEIPDHMTIESLQALPLARRQRLGQQIIYVMAPVYSELRPVVEQWAWQCKEESVILDKIFGAVPM